jgi:hypothetical protein
MKLTAIVAVVGFVTILEQAQTPNPASDPCRVPDRAARQVRVRDIEGLERAAAGARSGDTILLEDGRYRLRSSLNLSAPDITLRGRSGDAKAVVLHGDGMTNDPVGVALSVNAAGITVADMTIRDVKYHGVQVRGEAGASRFSLLRVSILDTGQQLLKVSTSNQSMFADDGLVACSTFSYTSTAPSNYTNGIDILAAKGWTIRDNRFERIRGPESDKWRGGPAILAWKSAEDTLIERNVIVDSYRGIALGLQPATGELARNGTRAHDHLRGVVRNNVIVNLNRWADEAIEANAAIGARIEHNSVFVEGGVPWSIAVRFGGATAEIRNNLSNHQILERDGGRATQSGNIVSATREFFVDPVAANLRLRPGVAAIDAGRPIPGLDLDFDRRPRIAGPAPDAGAFEHAAGKDPQWRR